MRRYSEAVVALLADRGVTMRQGTIVDATLIAAPSSTKNTKGKRDPEMHQTKKGNQGQDHQLRMLVRLLQKSSDGCPLIPWFKSE